MKAALSSPSCLLSCLGHSPGGSSGEGGSGGSGGSGSGSGSGSSPPALQASRPQGVCVSDGHVAVLLPLAPATLDVSGPEPRTLTRLYSYNGGYHLRILADGSVSGGRQENDPYDILRIKAVSAGVVVIRGEATGRYLAMDGKGRLYGSQSLNDECRFLEKYEENHYNTYRSQKYGWYVGLKRSGRAKAGPKTHLSQKAVFFLPRPVGHV